MPAAAGEGNRPFAVAERLLAWYDRHHRELPWRTPPARLAAGVRPDPYRVWLSEVMLQQTTVEAVKRYFAAFTERWPTVGDLAAASNDDIMRAWAGLGYYSRARNLKACADHVAGKLGGHFPDSEETLRELPGVGTYTAAAIAAIAFDRPAAVVDANVERVVARLARIDTPLPAAKSQMREIMAEMTPQRRPGDFAQAMMDLGATICTPRRPRCMLCPLNTGCAALEAGDPELYPIKAEKAPRPHRRGAAFVALRTDGAMLMRTRPPKGMLGGMTEVPTTGWGARADGATDVSAAPFAAAWRRAGTVSHVFTHFTLDLEVFAASGVAGRAPPGHRWVPAEEIPGEALPSLIKKAIEAAVPGATMRVKR
ncbi:MAG: A/G-specific adenine glycosylase [Rhizobiaceae bacterium]|nr:A/G-specific adenine glycosylase [Rhizobiaceae bacterium]